MDSRVRRTLALTFNRLFLNVQLTPSEVQDGHKESQNK